MCFDPASLSIIGTVFGATSAISQSRAQAAGYENQANAADQNAKIAEKQAVSAAENGAQEEKQMRQRGEATIGAQKASFAASGLDTGSGSAMDVIADTSTQNNLDALTVRKNAANQVWGYQAEQTNFKNQARAARSAASNAKTAGYMGAFGTVLQGVSSYKSKFGSKP